MSDLREAAELARTALRHARTAQLASQEIQICLNALDAALATPPTAGETVRVRKVVQITTAAVPDEALICALCDDGSMWMMGNSNAWGRIQDIPEVRATVEQSDG